LLCFYTLQPRDCNAFSQSSRRHHYQPPPPVAAADIAARGREPRRTGTWSASRRRHYARQMVMEMKSFSHFAMPPAIREKPVDASQRRSRRADEYAESFI